MIIKLNKLRRLFTLLLQEIPSIDKRIKFNIDYYWVISFEDAYSNQKPEPSVGSLCDDWESLKKIVHSESIISTIDFERLGNVINVIGSQFTNLKTNPEKYNDLCLRINLIDLENIAKKLLTKAEHSGFKEMDINIDYYWDIDPNDTYNLYEDPHINIKSLIGTWDTLKKILDGNHQILPLYFEQIGRLIKIVGEKIHQSENKAFWLTSNE